MFVSFAGVSIPIWDRLVDGIIAKFLNVEVVSETCFVCACFMVLAIS